jgi:hypothetical protein
MYAHIYICYISCIHSLFRYMNVSEEVMGYTHTRHITLHGPIEFLRVWGPAAHCYKTFKPRVGTDRRWAISFLLVMAVLVACHISFVYSISWVDQPNLKPKRFFDDMTNSFFPAETVQHHLCESQKHIRKLETPACWVVIAVTVFASWTHAARSFTPWSSSPHRLHRLHRPHRHRPRRPWLSRWWRRRRQGRAAQRHHPLGGADPT